MCWPEFSGDPTYNLKHFLHAVILNAIENVIKYLVFIGPTLCPSFSDCFTAGQILSGLTAIFLLQIVIFVLL